MKLSLFSLVILILLLSAVAVAAPSPQEATPSPPSLAFDINDCKTCHADQFRVFERTHHATLENSCARCHGDVGAHARSMLAGEGVGPVISLKSMAPADVVSKCLSCHDKARQANWRGGMHDRRGLACTTCHSVHDFFSDKAQIKTARVADTCYKCHPAVRAMGMRTSHHPIREGKVDCSNCHDPHDSTTPKMVRANTVNDLCYTCHTEKRGPFLWEHAPVRENCLNCHQPHGSNHEKLLVAKLPYLCQRCHANTRHPGTLYDLRNTAEGTNPNTRSLEHACKNCHQNIHGSNAPSAPYFGR